MQKFILDQGNLKKKRDKNADFQGGDENRKKYVEIPWRIMVKISKGNLERLSYKKSEIHIIGGENNHYNKF